MFLVPRREELKSRAEAYRQIHGLKIERELGHGMQGAVFSTSSATRQSTIEIHAAKAAYIEELDAYLRLREKHVATIRAHEPSSEIPVSRTAS